MPRARPLGEWLGVLGRACAMATMVVAAVAARDGMVTRLDALGDEFARSAALRCESCAGTVHATVVTMDVVRKTRRARVGSEEVVAGDFESVDGCETRFGAGTARYGFKIVNGTKRLVGPGVDALIKAPGDIIDRQGATEAMRVRCKAMMYELDDFVDTFVEAEESVKKSGVSPEEASQKVFMKLMNAICVERLRQCESVEWLGTNLQGVMNASITEQKRAERELIDKISKPATEEGAQPFVDANLAVSRCNGEDPDALSRTACIMLAENLMTKGQQSVRAHANFTGEAKKFQRKLDVGGETKLDDDDADKDGDVHELYAEAMLNASYIRANITLNRAVSYLSLSLDIDPKRASTEHNLAFAYRSGKNYTAAKTHLYALLSPARASEIPAETRAESSKLLCEIEHLEGNDQAAMEACERSIEFNPLNFHALRLKAQLHMVRFFREAEEIRANEHDPQEERQKESLRDVAEAKNLFTQALVLDPAKNEIAQLGMVLYFEQAAQDSALQKLTKEQLGALRHARHFCEQQGTELDNVCTDMLELAGNHVAELGFIALGNDALQMALTLDAKRTHLWTNLGYGFMSMGKFKMAGVAFDRASSADDSFELPEAIATLLKRGGEFERKLEEDRATASAKWTESRRPNKDERRALAAEVEATLSSLRGPAASSHDEL